MNSSSQAKTLVVFFSRSGRTRRVARAGIAHAREGAGMGVDWRFAA